MIIPALRYNDSRAAAKFLHQVFGLTQGMVMENEDGSIAHAEFWYGDSCIMMGVWHDVVPWHPQPGLSSIYVVVDDADAHFAVAKAAGAEILSEPMDTDYGSREYTARDCEGNVWSFGTYLPQKA